MTSATTRVRIAAVAAGLACAATLTSCDGSGGGASDGSSPGPSASAKPTSSASAGGTETAGPLQGSWLATTGGKAVALVITGKRAALFATGGTLCSGSAGKEAGMQMIHLTCMHGNKERATGMVDSVRHGTMKVTWSGPLGKEVFTKAEGGKLPTGLPTTGLGG